jgi:hypothetical protein
MALDLRSRRRPAQARRVGSQARVLLWCAALASAVAVMPHAHAQDNGAQGNGGQGNGQNAAPNGNNGNQGNGAPARKSAAQRTQDDAQRLLGGPSTTLGGYSMDGSTPDSQRDALLNSERMRVAKPNTQMGGGPAPAAGGDGAAAPAGGGIRRPARGGAAAGGAAGANGGAPGGVAAQRAAAANMGGGTAVYGDPYSARAGREVFKSPW